MAAFLDSDENFTMYRRFGWIQSRLLLSKQNELASLEKDLEMQDQPIDLASLDSESTGGEVTQYEAMSEYKDQLLKQAEKTFCEYGKMPISNIPREGRLLTESRSPTCLCCARHDASTQAFFIRVQQSEKLLQLLW